MSVYVGPGAAGQGEHSRAGKARVLQSMELQNIANKLVIDN